MTDGLMRIGELAHRTGTTPKALRLYEARGLIAKPRRLGRYRVYEPAHEDAVRLIRQAQAVGFRLQELQRLIRNAESGAWPGAAQLLQAVQAKRATLAQELQRLQRQDQWLADCEALLREGRLVLDCDDHPPGP